LSREEGRTPSPTLKSNLLTVEIVKLSSHRVIFHTMQSSNFVLYQPLSFLHQHVAQGIYFRYTALSVFYAPSVRMLKHCHYQHVSKVAIVHELPPRHILLELRSQSNREYHPLQSEEFQKHRGFQPFAYCL